MYDINIFDNSSEVLKRKEDTIYKRFILYFIVICVISVLICFINYPNQYTFQGIVNGKDIIVYLTEDSLGYFTNDTIEIKNDKFLYKINNIVEVDSDIKYKKYYKINISVTKELIENDVVRFSIIDGKTNLYKEFIKKIWKGFE